MQDVILKQDPRPVPWGIAPNPALKDPSFGPILDAVGPLDFATLLKPVYVALIGAIIGQKISYKEAKTLRAKIYTALGTSFSYVDVDLWLINQCPDLPDDKVKIIRRVNAYLSQKLPDYLETVSNIHELKQINGIGDWTIETTLLVSGKDWDVFPCGDYFIQKRIQRLYGLATKPTAKEVEEISNRWRPYRGLFAWYLWRWF